MEIDDRQRHEFHEALLDADSFETCRGVAGGDRGGGAEPAEAGERIVYTHEMLLEQTRISTRLATVEYLPDGGGTRLILTEQGRSWTDTTDPLGANTAWAALTPYAPTCDAADGTPSPHSRPGVSGLDPPSDVVAVTELGRCSAPSRDPTRA